MTVVVRRIAATPARSAAEAWAFIAALLAPPGCSARDELDRVAGIASSVIAAEAPRESPLVVCGPGPRLRVYCVYNEDALLGEDVSEDSLPWCPTDGSWALSLPCPAEDLAWVQRALAAVSSRVTARDEAAEWTEEVEPAPSARNETKAVDREAFFRP